MIPPIARRGLFLAPLLWLAGCNTVVLNPSGDIAAQQGNLVIVSTLLMLLIIVPVMILICLFAWRYRKSNTSAKYEPDWDHSTKLELLIWGAPLLIIIVLGAITWIYTHLLDPYRPLSRIDEHRPIAAGVKPLEIQVVSMDWKWMFIYPEQGIATVNKIVFPAHTPINFKVTSDTVMNSFFIPGLGGQIYAMAGMQTKLHLIANQNTELEGISANYSGAGFTGMKFKAIATTQEEFDAWVNDVKKAPKQLEKAEYEALSKPSQNNPVELYSSVTPNLFQTIIDKYEGMNPGKPMHHEKKEKEVAHNMEGMDMSSHSAAGAEE